MNNMAHWAIFKSKPENKEKLLLFYSGVFYKTFETDAEFLSSKFGFQILKNGQYKTVGFPISMKDKYLGNLKQNDYSYTIVKNIDGELKTTDEFTGKSNLEYDKNNLKFFKSKSTTTTTATVTNAPKVGEKDFTGFLKDLQALLQKYVQ